MQVVYRCDICLLQHVVDPDGSAIQKLLTSINRYHKMYCPQSSVAHMHTQRKTNSTLTLTPLLFMCLFLPPTGNRKGTVDFNIERHPNPNQIVFTNSYV